MLGPVEQCQVCNQRVGTTSGQPIRSLQMQITLGC